MAVRTGARVAERRDETLLHAFGNGVLEDAGFGIDLVPRHLENVGKQTLRQPIAPYHADGDLQAFSRELDVAAYFVFDVSIRDELLEHARNAGGSNSELRRQRRRRYAGALPFETIDGLHVHFERFGEVRVRVSGHRSSNYSIAREVPRRPDPVARAWPASRWAVQTSPRSRFVRSVRVHPAPQCVRRARTPP